MKFLYEICLMISCALATAPLSQHMPGWQLGKVAGDIKIRLFYDLL